MKIRTKLSEKAAKNPLAENASVFESQWRFDRATIRISVRQLPGETTEAFAEACRAILDDPRVRATMPKGTGEWIRIKVRSTSAGSLDDPPTIEADVCCPDFIAAVQDGTDNEGYGPLLAFMLEDDPLSGWCCGTRLPRVRFCPWCGHEYGDESRGASR